MVVHQSLLSPLFSVPLQIFHNGKYGSVCDDSWDIKDANVVCRMLGMGNATAAPKRAKYGQAVGDVWMDDVNCTGKSELNKVESSERKNVISVPEV